MTLNTSKHSSKGLRHLAVAGLLCLLSVVAYGQNLITNPGFELGATGYNTGYTVDTSPQAQGQAGVVTSKNANTIFGSAGSNLTIHGGTKYFAVNGATNGTSTVWEESISSLGFAGKTFTFSFYVAAGDTASTATGQIPVLSVTINGVSLGTVTTTTDGAWVQFTGSWTRGTNTVADIKLIDTTTSTAGNDFVLDDFVLVPEPSTYAAGVFLAGAGFFAWRKAKARRK